MKNIEYCENHNQPVIIIINESQPTSYLDKWCIHARQNKEKEMDLSK
jgi:hypothetical protein